MKAPLNRDQQIELMKTSAKRHEARFAALMSNRVVRATVSQPAPGQDDGAVYTQTRKRVACC